MSTGKMKLDGAGKFLAAFWALIIIFAIALGLASIGGCSGTMKSNTTQTVNTVDAVGNPVQVVTTTESEKPKDIAHDENTAEKHASCVRIQAVNANTVSLGLIKPMELKSGAAQAEYIEAVSDGQLIALTHMAIAAMSGDPETACHEAIAKESQAYYLMEAKRSSNRWGFGKFLAGTAAAYLIVDAWVDNATTAGASYYTTNVGNRSVGDAAPGGSGSVSASGDSQISDLTINNGYGNASDRAMSAFQTDKAIHVPLDGDSNFDQVDNGSQGGIIIDDPDGGNSGSLF